MQHPRRVGRLVLVRHAETVANAAKRLDSRPPGAELSDLGVRQASELAERLGHGRVGAVMASTALRASQTAIPIADRHGLDIDYRADLLEMDLGKYEGRTGPDAIKACLNHMARWRDGDHDHRIPGGESWNDVAARMLRALPKAADVAAADTDVVVVGHSGSIQIIAARLLGAESPAATGLLPNAGLLALVPTSDVTWAVERSEVIQQDASVRA